jgi:hypothetical protein
LYDLFNGFTSNVPPRIVTYFDKRYDNTYYRVSFETLAFPCLNYYRELFYNDEGKKIIPANIEDLLTPQGLAYWIMDDGGRCNTGLKLYTNNYTKQEVEPITNVIGSKFELDCWVAKETHQFSIFISSSSMNHLRSLISPYMHESMLYKLGI